MSRFWPIDRQNVPVAPHVLIVGRLSPESRNVRGEAFAAGQRYFHSVERAGGVPLMLPPIPALTDHLPESISRFDALVLHGGGDVDPRRYGEEPTADQLYGIVDEHDEVELAVVRAALDADLPLLAICRGMQILNVALGGSLVQHIGSDDHWYSTHPVALDADSKIAAAIGSSEAEACHSVHHQAIGRLGDGVRLVGRGLDDMPEAIEVESARWAIAVQWHPEDTAASDPQQQNLFDELLRQAASRPTS
jgi:putative glutamine amidotransferase